MVKENGCDEKDDTPRMMGTKININPWRYFIRLTEQGIKC